MSNDNLAVLLFLIILGVVALGIVMSGKSDRYKAELIELGFVEMQYHDKTIWVHMDQLGKLKVEK